MERHNEGGEFKSGLAWAAKLSPQGKAQDTTKDNWVIPYSGKVPTECISWLSQELQWEIGQELLPNFGDMETKTLRDYDLV